MTTRERNVVIILLAALLGGGFSLYLAVEKFLNPLRQYDREITGLEDDLSQKEQQVHALLREKLMLEKARPMSLPANPIKAASDYDRYLKTLLNESGLTIDNIQGPPPPENKTSAATPSAIKKAGHTVLAFQVRAKGSIANLVSALEKFQRTPVLHRIKAFTVDRLDATSKDNANPRLAIQLSIETLILNNSRPDAAPVFQPDLKKPLPGDGLTRTYGDIASKNIFVGPLPPAVVAKKETPDGPDMREHVRLDTTDPTNQEAFLINPAEKKTELRLRSNPMSGFDTFRIMDEERRRVLVRGKVLRIDQRDVFFQVDDDVYALHIGQSIADAMRRPLSDAELENLDLLDLVEPAAENSQSAEKKEPSKKEKGSTKKTRGRN